MKFQNKMLFGAAVMTLFQAGLPGAHIEARAGEFTTQVETVQRLSPDLRKVLEAEGASLIEITSPHFGFNSPYFDHWGLDRERKDEVITVREDGKIVLQATLSQSKRPFGFAQEDPHSKMKPMDGDYWLDREKHVRKQIEDEFAQNEPATSPWQVSKMLVDLDHPSVKKAGELVIQQLLAKEGPICTTLYNGALSKMESDPKREKISDLVSHLLHFATQGTSDVAATVAFTSEAKAVNENGPVYERVAAGLVRGLTEVQLYNFGIKQEPNSPYLHLVGMEQIFPANVDLPGFFSANRFQIMQATQQVLDNYQYSQRRLTTDEIAEDQRRREAALADQKAWEASHPVSERSLFLADLFGTEGGRVAGLPGLIFGAGVAAGLTPKQNLSPSDEVRAKISQASDHAQVYNPLTHTYVEMARRVPWTRPYAGKRSPLVRRAMGR